eukprot:6271824-Ditylum_brightwellii.AAC.1
MLAKNPWQMTVLIPFVAVIIIMYLGDNAANTAGHHISEEEMELAIRGLINLQLHVPRTDKEKIESLSQELDEQD